MAKIIEQIQKLKEPCIIAISGFGGSGKSSLAKQLGKELGISVIGVDSFQKKGAFDIQYKLWEIMDYTRLEKEIIIPFINKIEIINYGNFNANVEAITETIEIKNTGKIIIEGVGLFRPELLKYFDYKIWVDCPIEVAIERGKKRDMEYGKILTDNLWDGIWRQNDKEYFDTYKPKEAANFLYKN